MRVLPIGGMGPSDQQSILINTQSIQIAIPSVAQEVRPYMNPRPEKLTHPSFQGFAKLTNWHYGTQRFIAARTYARHVPYPGQVNSNHPHNLPPSNL